MTRILIIGLGSIGRRHMRNLAVQYPGAEFTVLRHAPRPDPLTDELGARIVTRLEDIIEEDFTLAVISSPSANHIDTLPAVIARGWNLLVEKPLVTTHADCRTVLEALASAPQAVRAAGFNFRHIPSLIEVRRRIREGALGTVVRASLTAGQWLPAWRPDQDWRTGYSADAARGGGVEMDLVHEIDLARWFFGDLELAAAFGGRLSSLDLAANDVSAMILRGAGGAGPLVQISLDYVARQRVRHYEIIGDKAGLQWDVNGRLDAITPDGIETLAQAPGGFDVGQSYVDMTARMAAAIEGDWQEPLQGLEDAASSTLLALEAREKGTAE